MKIEYLIGGAAVVTLIILIGVMFRTHEKIAREGWPADSICARRSQHGVDQLSATLDYPSKPDQESMKNYFSNINASAAQDADDFKAIIYSISAARNLGIAAKWTNCFPDSIALQSDGLFDEYNQNLEERKRVDKSTCSINFQKDIVNFLEHKFQCRRAEASDDK